jgi:hypothetical protein
MNTVTKTLDFEVQYLKTTIKIAGLFSWVISTKSMVVKFSHTALHQTLWAEEALLKLPGPPPQILTGSALGYI